MIECMHAWLDDWVNEQMRDWVSEGWMDGWVSELLLWSSLLSYFLTKWPLRWGTSSSRYFFSEVSLWSGMLLHWPTPGLSCPLLLATFAKASAAPSVLRPPAAIPLACTKVAGSLLKDSLFCSCYNAFAAIHGRKVAASPKKSCQG